MSKIALLNDSLRRTFSGGKVVMTDGAEFMTRSTYGQADATLHLDIDPKTHPAWTGGSQQLLDRGGRLSRFNSRFKGLSMGKGK